MKCIKFFILFSFLASFSANALLEVNIIKSKEVSFPIVIAPFEMIGDFEEDVDLVEIIRENLNRSGQFDAKNTDKLINGQINFDFYKKFKQDAIVFGKIRKVSAKVNHVEIYVYDVLTQKPLYVNKKGFNKGSLRRIGHIISDDIYEALLGQKGSFNTRLSFVTVNEEKNGKRIYRLKISDWDGMNEQTILKSDDPILSPAWSADQSKIAYV